MIETIVDRPNEQTNDFLHQMVNFLRAFQAESNCRIACNRRCGLESDLMTNQYICNSPISPDCAGVCGCFLLLPTSFMR